MTTVVVYDTGGSWKMPSIQLEYVAPNIWQCPINVVLKVLLKTKIRPDGDKIQKN